MSQRKSALKILSGMVLVPVIHIIAMVALLLIRGPVVTVFPDLDDPYGFNYLALVVFAGLSFYQLLYVVPLTIFLRRRGENDIAKGIIFSAVITALLCGACFFAFFGPV
ncbi:MAG: hypothetical protein AAF635_08150 [Cyanobacteria bacterium P01_C01_bin.69]